MCLRIGVEEEGKEEEGKRKSERSKVDKQKCDVVGGWRQYPRD